MEPISFADNDSQSLCHPHDDPLIISPIIGNCIVDRMFVDTGSSADVLFLRTYDGMALPRSLLKAVNTPLMGFTGHTTYPVGTILLDMTLG